MASSLLTTYLGSGLLAARPAAPSLPTGGLAFYYATDTSLVYAYDSSWHTVGSVASVFGRTGAVTAAAGDYTADEVDYNNGTSGLTATDVQAAIDEVVASIGSTGLAWFTGGIGDTAGTVNTSATATKGVRITPRVDITVDAIIAEIDQNATSDTYRYQIAQLSDNTATATISSVLQTGSNQSNGTTTIQNDRFVLTTPLVLTASTTYLIAIVNSTGVGTTVCRVFGNTAGKNNPRMQAPVTHHGRFVYNTVNVSGGQSPTTAEDDASFCIYLEGTFAV